MAEEFQAAICGGTTATTWWNPSRTVLSPCSVAGFGFNLINEHHHNQMGSYGWSTSNDDHIVDPKSTTSINNSNIVSRSSNCDQESNNSVISGDSSVIFQNQKTTDSDSGGSSSIFMDSTFNMMGFGLPSSSTSSSPTDWNHALLHENVRGGEDNNYGSMIQEDMINNHDSSSSTVNNISQGLYGYPSTLLQAGLFEPNQTQQQQSALFNNRSINNYLSTVNNYRPNSNDVVLSTPSWTKPTASFQKQQPSSLQFNKNTPFWNASTTGFLPNSSPSQIISPTVGNNKLNSFSSLTTKCNNNHEEVRDSGSVVKKGSSEPAFKRPRIETPSPLPTFKVRKEKLGDRITALQQLVSPFGKTDTASVLHEAIEYIKFLHDQVSVLSTPYMKQGNPIQQQQGAEKLMKDAETPRQDLRSRGLCLLPISSTFPVANETTPHFWTPTFGGSYR